MSSILLETYGLIRRELNLRATGALRAMEIGPKQAIMLRYIQKNPKSSLAQLSRMTATDPAASGRAIDCLIKQGWITKEEHPSDRRRWVLVLTSEGRKKMSNVNKVYNSLAKVFLEALGPKEQEQFGKLLRKILTQLKPETKKVDE